MNGAQERLVKCFSTVFPNLSPDEILHASSDSVPSWDSLAMVTLLAVIEEEFAMQFPPSALENLVSFDAFWKFMRPRFLAAGTPADTALSAANA